MRIVIDLDGTICPIKQSGERYEDLEPIPGAVEKLRELKSAGHYIIIQTARNMATQDGNIGKVMRNIGKITLDWLARYEVVYDEIFFGKPNAHLYIDDRAFRFTAWNEVTPSLIEELARER
jgi:capsule biosynthesis phosphatase